MSLETVKIVRLVAGIAIWMLCVVSGRTQDAAGGSDLPSEALSADQARSLRDGWKKLRGPEALPVPSVAVVVGLRRGDAFVPGESAMAKVTRADLREQLSRQLGPLRAAVIADEAATKGLKGLSAALQERGGPAAAETAAELLNEFIGADVLIEVELVPAADATRARRVFRAMDARARPARILAEDSYTDHPLEAPAEAREAGRWMSRMRRGTTEMLGRLAAALAEREPYVPTYRVQALDVPKLDFDKWSRAIRQATIPGLRLVRAPLQLSRTGSDVMPLWFEYAGEWTHVEDLLADTAEKATGRRLLKVFDSGAFDFVVTLQHPREPWARFVGENALPPAERIGPLLSPERRPSVTVLFGTDIEAPVAALTDERTELAPLAMGEEVMARTLARHFSAAGFEVKDAAAVRRQLQERLDRANLGRNLSGLRQALRSSHSSDYLVLVKADRAGAMNLTVLDARGAQVAFAYYPDQRVRLYEGFVDVRDPDSLARYLAGSLFEQLHVYAADKASLSIEVLLKNTHNAHQAMEIAAAFRRLPGVRSVTDLKIDQALARFSVNTTGDASALVQLAADLASRQKLGAGGILECANEQQIVFNVAPVWLSAFDPDAKPVRGETAARPDDSPPVTAAGVSGTAPVLVDAMRAARDSVWVVGFDLPDGRFIGVGTAWTVRDRLLATNAHVLGDPRELDLESPGALNEIAAYLKQKKIAATPVARNGANLGHRIGLDLGQGRVHPAYSVFSRKYGGRAFPLAVYDVALIPTTDPAGRPLPLASTEELHALEPLSPMGYCGYPAENRAGQGRSQQSLVGGITSLTSVFLMESEQRTKRRLIHFSLASAGGASGSPLFGANGRVIGLLSAGDYAFVDQFVRDADGAVARDKSGNVALATTPKRIPVGFTYGQRVDMLRDLMEGRVDLTQLEAEWARDVAEVAELQMGRPRR